jgi:hypothetical protein
VVEAALGRGGVGKALRALGSAPLHKDTTSPLLPPFVRALWGILWGINFKANEKGAGFWPNHLKLFWRP